MNEQWASEVERKIRTISDQLNSIGRTALRNEGVNNFGFPVVTPPTGSAADEIVWIRLTEKSVSGGYYRYGWRRQDYTGASWVDTGDAGTLDDTPAVGLNNDDRPVNDGKRYPAVYDAGSGQWIFFLMLATSGDPGGYVDPPPAGMYPFGWTSLHVTAKYDEGITISPDIFIYDYGVTFNQVLEFMNGLRNQLYAPYATWYSNLNGNSGPFGGSGPIGSIAHYSNGYYSSAPSPPFGIGSWANSSPHVVCTTLGAVWSNSNLAHVISGISESTDFLELGKIHVGMAGKRWTPGIGANGKLGFNVLPNLRTEPEGFPIIPYDGFNPFCYYNRSGSVTVDATLYIKVVNNLGVYLYDDEYPATLTYEWSILSSIASGRRALASMTSSVGPTPVRLASSTLSNSIPPSRVTTKAAAQIGSVDPNTLQSITEPKTTMLAGVVSAASMSAIPLEATTTALAVSYSEAEPFPATSTVSTAGQAYTVPRAFPALAETVSFANLGVVVIRTPNLVESSSLASTLCVAGPVALPVPVTTGSIVGSTIGANSATIVMPEASHIAAQSLVDHVSIVRFAIGQSTITAIESQSIAASVRRPTAPATFTVATTFSGAAFVNLPDPGDAMSGATTSLSIVTIRPVSIPITETNPRVTVSTSLTAAIENPYEEFCEFLANNGANWNQLEGLLTVKINGAAVTSSDAGDFTGGVTISFEFSATLQRFLDENTDVTITHEWETVCSGVPKLPTTGSGSVTHNGSVSVPFVNNCGGEYREASMMITMTTPTLRNLFDTTCSPWGTNQGITTRTVNLAFDIFP